VLLGETGSGKTLTLKIAAGLLRPDSGTVDVLGERVSQMSERELLALRRKAGFVFQEGALFDSLTVGENVAYRLHEDHVNEEEIEPRVREVLEFVELGHTQKLLPSELSGGMRRRVSIARAVVNRPPIVFYDSPTAAWTRSLRKPSSRSSSACATFTASPPCSPRSACRMASRSPISISIPPRGVSAGIPSRKNQAPP